MAISDAASAGQTTATDETDAALFSTADLTICGNGSLEIWGNRSDGIASKDGLVIAGGTLSVTAADDGIRGKDYSLLKGGTVSVVSGGDGIRSSNQDGSSKGYIDGAIITVEGGTIHVLASDDGFNASDGIGGSQPGAPGTMLGAPGAAPTSATASSNVRGPRCVS